MINDDFKWLLDKLDNSSSVLNDSEFMLIREELVKLLANIDPIK